VVTLAKQFAVVFFLGFIVFVVALGLGGMASKVPSEILSANTHLLGLRYLGIGLMAGGLALWIAKRRSEGGKEGLNTLIGWLVVLGSAALIAGVIWADALAELIGPIGIGFTVSALVVGFLATLLAPAGPMPLSAQWPEGGEPVPAATDIHDHAANAGEAGGEHAH
jgi:hypothetical protein